MGFGYVCQVCMSLVRIMAMRMKEPPLMSLVRIAFSLQVLRRALKDAFNTRSYRGRRQARRGLLRYTAPRVG